MKQLIGLFSIGLLAACDVEQASGAAGAARDEPSSAASRPAALSAPVKPSADRTATADTPADTKNTKVPFAGRTRRVTNPDGLVMVLLYNQLAGLSPSVSEWVEKDQRVSQAPPVKKPEIRKTIAEEIAAADEAVKDIGAIRITTNTQLSEYDPTYEEYLVSALDPASMFTFTSNEQTVRLKFSNADDAQIWRVPADAYQAIEDRIQYRGALTLTIDAEIERTQPGVKGGDIIARITGYVLENNFNNGLIARVPVENAGDR